MWCHRLVGKAALSDAVSSSCLPSPEVRSESGVSEPWHAQMINVSGKENWFRRYSLAHKSLCVPRTCRTRASSHQGIMGSDSYMESSLTGECLKKVPGFWNQLKQVRHKALNCTFCATSMTITCKTTFKESDCKLQPSGQSSMWGLMVPPGATHSHGTL